jgi:lipid-binding SYLF domain-containing protein
MMPSASAKTAAEIDAGVEAARDQSAAQIPATKAAVGVGGSYGEGALIVGGKNAGYYSATSASIGLQLGAQTSAQIIMFMTAEALDQFRNSSGWEAGANAQVTMIDEGKAADIDSVLRSTPVVAFVFGQKGLMGDLSVEGSKITKLER